MLNLYHHGVQHEQGDGHWYNKQACPLLQAWGTFILLCNMTMGHWKRNKQSEMDYIRQHVNEAIAAGMIPFVINEHQETR